MNKWLQKSICIFTAGFPADICSLVTVFCIHCFSIPVSSCCGWTTPLAITTGNFEHIESYDILGLEIMQHSSGHAQGCAKRKVPHGSGVLLL